MTQPSYVADELTKLAELYQSGALTEDEFRNYKARLLAVGQHGNTVPSTSKATTKLSGILTFSGLIIGAAAGLLPATWWAPRNGLGGWLVRTIYFPADKYVTNVFWGILTETLAVYAAFFLLMWLVVRKISAPLMVGIIAGVLYAVIRFLVGLPTLLMMMAFENGKYADGLMENRIATLGANLVSWTVIFSIVAFVAMRTRDNVRENARIVI